MTSAINWNLEGIIMAENNVKSKEKTIHDGVSPINIPEEENENKVFQILWEYLVPSYGKAQTAQGEIIRIAGRVQHEFLDNGCIKYLQLGNGFNDKDLKVAEVLVQLLKENGDKGFIDNRLTTVLCSCAMAWIKQNPEVIEPLKAEYNR